MIRTPTRHSASRARKMPPPRRAPMQRVAVPDDGDKPPQLRMIFKVEVIRRVGVTYPTLWSWMRDGKFPLSFEIGGKTAWREDEIDHWLATRPRSVFKRNES